MAWEAERERAAVARHLAGKAAQPGPRFLVPVMASGEESWASHPHRSQDKATAPASHHSPFTVAPVAAHTQVAMDGVRSVAFVTAALS